MLHNSRSWHILAHSGVPTATWHILPQAFLSRALLALYRRYSAAARPVGELPSLGACLLPDWDPRHPAALRMRDAGAEYAHVKATAIAGPATVFGMSSGSCANGYSSGAHSSSARPMQRMRSVSSTSSSSSSVAAFGAPVASVSCVSHQPGASTTRTKSSGGVPAGSRSAKRSGWARSLSISTSSATEAGDPDASYSSSPAP